MSMGYWESRDKETKISWQEKLLLVGAVILLSWSFILKAYDAYGCNNGECPKPPSIVQPPPVVVPPTNVPPSTPTNGGGGSSIQGGGGPPCLIAGTCSPCGFMTGISKQNCIDNQLSTSTKPIVNPPPVYTCPGECKG